MSKTLEELEQQLDEMFPYSINYKRQLALEIIMELEMRMISPFEFLDKMLNNKFPYSYSDVESEPSEKLEDCVCLENHEC